MSDSATSITFDTESPCAALKMRLDALLEKLLGEPDPEGVKHAAKLLGIFDDDAVNVGDDSETDAVLDYYLNAAPIDGTTRIEQFVADPGELDEDEQRLLNALAKSTFSVFEHKPGSVEGSVLYHDMLGDASFEDPEPWLHTMPGQAFAARVVRDGELWCPAHTPLPLEPRIKRFFTIPKAVRDLAVTLPDAEDLKLDTMHPRLVLRAVLAGRAVKDYMDETGARIAPKRPPRSLKRSGKRRRK